jgi:hypothetical protein
LWALVEAELFVAFGLLREVLLHKLFVLVFVHVLGHFPDFGVDDFLPIITEELVDVVLLVWFLHLK